MDNNERQKIVVDKLMENELVMADLYREFSLKFDNFRKFWTDIVEDEKSHAAWINTLYNKMEAGLVDFTDIRFPMQAIQSNIDFMDKKIKESKEGKINYLQALEIAVHLEKGMLENKFFEVFKNDSLELQIILEALRMGTNEHCRQVERVWKIEKCGNECKKMTE